MRKRTRGVAAAAGLAALALVAAACGGSSGGTTSSGNSSSGSQTFGLQGLNSAGTPKSGGTLNMLGQGDVDFMDYNVSYYTIGALGQRPWLRLLYAYPATPGKTTTVVPGPGHRDADHHQRRQDVLGDDPHRCDVGQQPAAPGHRGRRAARPQAFLQPDPAVRRPAGLRGADRRLPAVLHRLRQGLLDLRVGAEEVHRQTHQISGVEGLRADDHLQPGPPGQLLHGHAAAGRVRAGAGGEPELPGRERRGRPAHHRRRAVQDHELCARPEHHLRPQPGVEGEHRPGPQGVRQRDQGH